MADTPATETLEGERKTVTMLFADIKGSMDLMEDLDPEEARAIVDPALKLMMEAAVNTYRHHCLRARRRTRRRIFPQAQWQRRIADT